MHYIIKIDSVRLLVSNENDARDLTSALLSAKVVESNWKHGESERFTINNEYELTIKFIERDQITNKNNIKIQAPNSFPDGSAGFIEDQKMDKDDVSPI